jgi:hypothetical protein
MATILLAAITILLILILIVLVHHIPREEWSALLNRGLRICWAVLIVLVAVSQVAITIVWEARHHELSFLVSVTPVFFFFLSFVPFAMSNPDHYEWGKVVRLVLQWTLMAFGLLLLAWWDPIPTSPTIKEFTDKLMKGPFGEVIAWTWVLVVVAFIAKIIREEWPSLVAPTASEVAEEPSER